MADSIHDKLERVRKPRVHIKYEVETEGAMIEKELPFVVGVLGDFSGDPGQPLRPFRDRKFTQIDRDNFDDVMARMTPGLTLQVDNTLLDDGTDIGVRLNFSKMSDFDPAAVVAQVPALANLLEIRNKLRDLLAKADRSDSLEAILQTILQDNAQLRRLAGELDPATAGRDGGAKPAGSA
ncbi:type VI secretion system contractile sheath small subunit [Lichenibacterium ramalinae]|uniref:Type VI secretion system contractile sheath small subunit n=1 Tax=Lichenibacterium ramalinae TaxID=2316527 RepID=A0A4Q2R7A5_9HYPH|nr:type VI secretion system contractile sheath small subunit [Lichenibacterium ramalinae]RYB01613.1 type VI secretion system contractile sheath small subunit [Lichenibacterium ramalinae]